MVYTTEHPGYVENSDGQLVFFYEVRYENELPPDLLTYQPPREK